MASPEPPSSRYAGRRRSRNPQSKLKQPPGRRKSSDKQQAQVGANLVAPIAKLRQQNISAWERKFGANKTGKISAYSETDRRSHNPKSQPQQAPLHRIIVVWIVLIVSGLSLAWNLYRLQVVRGPVLEGRAKQQQAVTLRPYVPRRPIVDRNNNILAIDRPAYTLYAHPKLFKTSKQEVATKLSPLLGRSAEDLEKLFNKTESGIRLENSLLEEVADRIVALRVDGLELLPHYSRLYPQQELAADIVGYVDMDHIGQAGIERSQQNLLERSIKAVRLSRTGNGAIMPDYAPIGVMNTDDLRLQLTVDSRLQRATRSALKEKIAQFQAKRGTAIVMDARDGALLAMVSEPSYDPNHYSKYNVELFKNWALTDLYEPGSTFKPLNVAIALETGAI
ncbi:hypothetical protein H6S82_12455, partial [Planktothrix sp. FACHB-1355]